MKKFVSGLLVGALLMFSSQAFGEGISYLGKKIDGQVTVQVNGQAIGEAIVVQGKSFAPVRDIVNSFGGTVDSTTGGVISLSSNKDGDTTAVNGDKQAKIEAQKKVVERISGLVSELESKVETLKAKGIEPTTQSIELNLMRESLEKEQKVLVELESE